MSLVPRSSIHLHDRHVAIRPFVPADAQPAFQAVLESRADAAPWLPDLANTLSISDVSAYIDRQPHAWASDEAYNFAIVDHRTGDFLGGCGLTQVNRRHGFANMYYWVRTGRTGRGIATRAVRLLARFGCGTLGLQRVEIVVAVGNAASLRVADKAGATREGILRSRILLHGVLHDAVMFSFVGPDFVG